MKRRRLAKTVGLGLAGLVLLWLLGDFLYSRVIAFRLRRWEATIQRDANGVQAGCRAYTVGSGRMALLLVHGINDSPYGYRKMAPLLAEQGFTCRVMRLPGFAVPIRRMQRVSKERWVGGVRREVARLRQEHPCVGVVAHSLGGAVTIAYLLEHPGAVDAVVLLAPAIKVSNRRSPILPTRAWHAIGRWTLLFTRVTQTPFEQDAHDPTERDYPGRPRFAARKLFDETFRLIDANRGRAGALTVPLMMVLSRDDQVIDWRAAARFYDEAGSTRKTIRFMQDAGHAIPVDYGWRALTLEMAAFFRQCEQGSEPTAGGPRLPARG